MPRFPEGTLRAATEVLEAARARGWMITTAESCTGGLVAACLTEVAGSSDVVERGLVTYSNQAKTELLGVPEQMLAEFGAVSERVARAMAKGALARSAAQLSISVTGVAGPGGGTAEKPVGLVHFATATSEETLANSQHFDGDREEVRLASVDHALALLRERLLHG